ncbi:MAG: 7TMR-DISM family protein, partial [Rhodoferax sp.]
MIARPSGFSWHARRKYAINPQPAGLRWFWLALWIGLFGLWGNAGASEPGLGGLSAPAVQLDSQVAGNLIGQQMRYLADPAGTLTLAQVVAMPERFTLSPQPTPNFSFTRSSYWFHVRLENRNAPEQHWLLETQYPLLDHITLYALRDGQLSDTTQGGRALAFAQRPLKHRNFIYGFEAAAGQSLDLYIQVRTSSSLQLPMALWTQASFRAKDHEEQLALGLYYGVLAAMLLYNLMIFLSIREISYFHYLHFISGYILFQLALNGLAYEYFWPNSPQWGAAALPTLIFFTLIGVLNFSRTFLNLGAHLPRVNRWLRYYAYLLALLGVSAVVGDYAIMIKLATVSALIAVVTVLVCGASSLLRGERQARYFLLAWAALMAGVAAYVLKTFDLLPSNMLTEYGLQIGSAVEVVLLSFALA